VGVFVHQIVVVGDFPVLGGLVVEGKHVQQIVPFHVGLEPDYVLRQVIVVVAQKDLRVVLILHVKLHGRCNQGRDSNSVRLVVGVYAVNHVALVVLGGVINTLGTHQGRLRLVPLVGRTVLQTLDAETVGNLHLEHFDGRLSHSKVGHLNVKAVEVDTVETLVDCQAKLTFANFPNSFFVVQCAELMELPEQVVEVYKGARVVSVYAPEGIILQSLMLGLEIINDLVKVPREGQNVSMFLLRELSVNAESGIL
jgi:hypothetical protein